jgi:hypothetical protein
VDVFAVGVMLWEVLARKRFAPGGPSEAAIDARLAGSEPRLSSIAPDVDPALAAICDRAMHVDIAQRYATAEEFRVALEQYLMSRGEVAQAGEIGAVVRQRFTGERKRMHELINVQVTKQVASDDGASSIIRALTRGDGGTTPGSTTPGRGVPRERNLGLYDEEPTPVGDLSKWIESSRADNPIPLVIRSARHKSRRRRKWVLSAIGVAAFCGTYAWVRTRIEEPRAARSASQAPARSAPLVVAPPPPAPPIVMASEAPPSAPDPNRDSHLSKRVRRRATRTEAEALSDTPPASPTLSPSVAPAPRPRTSVAQPAVDPARASASPVPNSSSSVQLGDDLRSRRSVRVRGPRPIETDDPFR